MLRPCDDLTARSRGLLAGVSARASHAGPRGKSKGPPGRLRGTPGLCRDEVLQSPRRAPMRTTYKSVGRATQIVMRDTARDRVLSRS